MAWETQETIQKWCDRGRAQNKPIMFLCCDRFDYEQYPVYVDATDFWTEYDKHNGVNMQSIDAVYDLSSSSKPKTLQPDMYPVREEVLTFTLKIPKSRVHIKDSRGRVVRTQEVFRVFLDLDAGTVKLADPQ
jgi:hypothetical protein